MEKVKLNSYINGFKIDDYTKQSLQKVAKKKSREMQEIVRLACKVLVKAFEGGRVFNDEDFS